MKAYTQEDYDWFPVIDGIKRCRSGDYSQIKIFDKQCSFGERCSFGEQCSFGERCSFGEQCSFGERCSFEGAIANRGYPFLTFGGGGSENRTVYCFNTVTGLIFRAGCFVGSKEQFVEKVLDDDETENKSSIKTRQYLGFVDICDLTFNEIK